MTLSRLFLFLLLFIFTSVGYAQSYREKIDPYLLKQQHGKQSCLVSFGRSDIASAAKKIKGKSQKGSFVFHSLKNEADLKQKRVVAFLKANKLHYRSFTVANAIAVEAEISDIMTIAAMAEVEKIYFDYPVRSESYEEERVAANNRSGEPEWGLKKIQADSVWKLGFEGQNVVVGGNDTGYEWQIEALKSKYRGYQSTGDVDHNYHWHDAIHDISPLSSDSINPCGLDVKEPCDDDNHGTHTMGTMVGKDTANVIGVAPEARWIGCRCMEGGWGKLSTYLECLEWFMAPTDLNGQHPNPALAPHVINNSWYCAVMEGCNPDNWAALETAVINLKAAGIVVVVSAGNSGPNCETVTGPPGFFDPSFSIGATNSEDLIAGFSSRGPVSIDSSFRMKPDISAPGVSVRSVIRGGGFAFFNGTSMASPHVSGTVALMISANPDLAGEVDLIEQLIIESVDPLYSDQECGGISGQAIPNPIFGFGRLNALKAVEKALAIIVNGSEEPLKEAFGVYPNPADQILFVEPAHAEKCHLTMCDANGRIVILKDFQGKLGLDIAQLPKGMYVLSLAAANGNQQIKWVKM